MVSQSLIFCLTVARQSSIHEVCGMKLSIVATLYQLSLSTSFSERASADAKRMVGDDYEIVLVNDGSPDNSLDLAVRLTEQDSHVVVVDLSRNFGHTAIDDLDWRTPKELVFSSIATLKRNPGIKGVRAADEQDRCDVVHRSRRETGLSRWSRSVVSIVSSKRFNGTCAAKRCDSSADGERYVDALLCHQEREVLWRACGTSPVSTSALR